MTDPGPGNHLYYGDNLDVLRGMPDGFVDLIYLDPPFNSNASYNVLFRDTSGAGSGSQIEAFDDTWHWGDPAEAAFQAVRDSGRHGASAMLEAMRAALGTNDMMAYLAMMAARLIELHRVLKDTGSLYLHCDPTASHYLKVLLDGVFGASRFVNEITWKRSSAHSDGGQGSKHYGRVSDIILFYSKSEQRIWNTQYSDYGEEYIDRDYRRVEPDGRRYRLSDLSGPGGAAKGNPSYEVMGVTRHWRYSQERMGMLLSEGRIVQTRPGAVPQMKRYLDEMKGIPIQDIWSDIQLNNRAKEKLGYPTQKPVALLERIIAASSNPSDLVLDPFCGCGTTVHAAEKLGRRWIGIDVTHLAIGLIQKRLRDAWPAVQFRVHGEPADLAGARQWFVDDDKTKKEWEKWAPSLLGDAQPFRSGKKGADGGIDGIIPFGSTQRAIVSVKGGAVGVAQVRELVEVVNSNKAQVGVVLTLEEPTKPMLAHAAGAGLYALDGWKPVPKVQVVTIERAMALRARAVDIPARRGDAFRRAPREEARGAAGDLFG